MDAMDTTDADAMAAVHGCCVDGPTAVATGSPCKAGMACVLSCAGILPMPGLPTAQPAATSPFLLAMLFPRSFVPSAIWRPPSSR